YKPLFAPLIVDLDSKINLFAHGNIMAPGNQPFSNQGWGPWEVNLSKVLGAGPGESLKLFQDNPSNSPINRYGPNAPVIGSGPVKSPLNNSFNAPDPPYWSKIDFGSDIGGPMIYPGQTPTTSTYGPTNSKLQ